MARPFPGEWRKWLESSWPLYRRLPDDLREELERRVQVFVAEKSFEGCLGLEVTEEMKVLISAQACLLVLGNPHQHYDSLRSILVFPDEYRSSDVEVDEYGIHHEEDGEVLGESWDCGTVSLSWSSTVGGARDIEDGLNVVIHEFAHQLDQESGLANGTPILRGRERYAAWREVMSREFERLQEKVDRGRRTVMDDYGATHPAEFFAVATECFFEKPEQLKERRPELYEQLKIFYGQDPVEYR